MANSDSQDVVGSSNPASNPARSVPPTFSSFFRPRMLFAVLGVVLVIGVVSIMSRSECPAVVPHLIGVRVDPQLDSLRLRLEAADLALGDVSVAPCPEFDIPGCLPRKSPRHDHRSAPGRWRERRLVHRGRRDRVPPRQGLTQSASGSSRSTSEPAHSVAGVGSFLPRNRHR